MATRISRLAAPMSSSVAQVLRRGRSSPDKGKKERRIVKFDGEEVVTPLLKTAPRTVSHFRKGEYLHVSDVLGKCVRKIALTERYGVDVPGAGVQESLALTFAQGVAIHDHVKSRIFAKCGDTMYGSWECRCGGLKVQHVLYRGVKERICEVCKGAPNNYHELDLRDEETLLIGSPDITLYLEEQDVYYPIEIKSIAHEEWKNLTRPKPDHVLQAMFYWYLLRKAGYSVPSQVSILYATKGYLFGFPYKEFVVPAEENAGRLQQYIAEAKALKAAKSGGELPQRTCCSSQDCSMAKQCHVAILCFQHK